MFNFTVSTFYFILFTVLFYFNILTVIESIGKLYFFSMHSINFNSIGFCVLKGIADFHHETVESL